MKIRQNCSNCSNIISVNKKPICSITRKYMKDPICDCTLFDNNKRITTVIIVVPKGLTCLAGHAYGKEIYEKQIKRYVNVNNKTIIKFPVKMISTSFVESILRYAYIDINEPIKYSEFKKQFIMQVYKHGKFVDKEYY